ncbi:TniB family NTP-binding protein [Limimaricola cinnabarinus]|uniref:TniB family NTP-binding protein n=1 Tax=Limimaricola cinnabarinus TaxID=1125964 RepID=UPI002490D6E1|nr:TniB family NTP-binding protein [Limimaricola cinnabarinus]
MVDMNTLTASSSIPEKVDWLAERYWKFSRDERLLESLKGLFVLDKDGELTSEPARDPLTRETAGLMVLAPSGSGKTALLMRAIRATKVLSEVAEGEAGNTMYVTVPAEATIKSLAELIARRAGYGGMTSKIRAHEAWAVARHRLRVAGIKLLIIDEAHHLVRPGPGRDVPGAVQSLKHLLQGDAAVAVILVGVPKLREAVMSDEETDRRFEKLPLKPISAGSREAEHFAKCCEWMASSLGLTMAVRDRLPERILFAEQGQLGRAVDLFKETMTRALRARREFPSLEDAEQRFEALYGPREMSPFAPGNWDAVKSELEKSGWGR